MSWQERVLIYIAIPLLAVVVMWFWWSQLTSGDML